MDDLEELLKDLQEHPLTKENENDARNDFNLSDFESILVNPEGKGSLPRPLRAAYQATTNGSGIPNNTSLGRIVGSLRNSHDPPRLAETTAATEKQGISKTISSTSESTRTASGKPLKLCAICDQGIQKGGSALNGTCLHKVCPDLFHQKSTFPFLKKSLISPVNLLMFLLFYRSILSFRTFYM